MRRIGRHPHHDKAELAGGRQVDVVEARAAQCDQFDSELGKGFEAGAVGLIIDEDACRESSLGCGRRFGTEPEFMEAPSEALRAGGLVEIFAVVGFGVEYGDFNHGGDAFRWAVFLNRLVMVFSKPTIR